jgi:hypothetical protein
VTSIFREEELSRKWKKATRKKKMWGRKGQQRKGRQAWNAGGTTEAEMGWRLAKARSFAPPLKGQSSEIFIPFFDIYG